MPDIDIAIITGVAKLETKVETLESGLARLDERLLAVEHKASMMEGAELKGELDSLRRRADQNARDIAVSREALSQLKHRERISGGSVSERAEAPPGSVFVSYRRADSRDAGRICDRLVAALGSAALFQDVRDIAPGLDFREQLDKALSRCRVAVVVIGPTWGESVQEEEDWVHVEVAAVLKKTIPVIPVLVGRSAMPRELPADLEDFSYRQAIEILEDPNFDGCLDRLIEGIRGHL